MTAGKIVRCDWAGAEPNMVHYHDTVWGVPVHDDRELFEFLILEGAQAGLSWSTILNRLETYRAAYDNFDAEKVAAYGEADVARLLADPGIIRNRAKVSASIKNANAALEVKREFGSLDSYLWKFVDGKTTVNSFEVMAELPAETEVSKATRGDRSIQGNE